MLPFFNSSTCFFKSSISCLSSLIPSIATTPSISYCTALIPSLSVLTTSGKCSSKFYAIVPI
nr:MAG TPA: hypothetical protein [Crassvirales sp.]